MDKKPTLQEIAEMPFPASERALFKHYGVRPKSPNPDAAKAFEVTINYSYRICESVVYEIDADSEDEAEELALNRFDNDFGADEDVDDIVVEEIDE